MRNLIHKRRKMVKLTSLGRIGTNTSRGLFWWFRLGILGVFLAFILINSIIIGFEQKSIDPVIQDLGDRFLNPLLTLQEESNKLFIEDTSQLSLFDKLFSYWDFFSCIYVIYLWLWIIFILITTAVGVGVPSLNRWGVAVFLFFIIILIKLASQNQPLMTPFYALKSGISGIIKLIKSFV